MQKRVFIIHGWEEYPENAWFPWIKNELEKRGFEVFVPAMPDSSNPKIEAWVLFLKNLVGKCDENTYFIGHSMGCRTIIKYLDELGDNEKAGGVVFVAGWVSLTPMAMRTEEEKEIVRKWLVASIDYEKVKKIGRKFVAIFSDDDEYVPFEENSKTYKEKLGSEIILEHGKGHFSDDAGIKELPSALNSILEIANKS
ncbi:MAG: alpha/beta hydrolase [Candidatus Wolfebacteria bacterium]|nr:alpha/beta hydrolase [Candidatus Wolfebacteria bacterium]